MQYFANSDTGRRRRENQDRYLMLPLGNRAFLAAVFDGMGGHACGDLAAECAAAHFTEVFSTVPENEDEAAALLCRAARLADAAIHALVAEDEERRGMGTTVTALLFIGRRVLSMNIGDSRSYLYRTGELVRLTHDDSYVQALIDAGRLDPRDAGDHPRRNVILRALGALGHGDIDISRFDILSGDTYLLCSDGLTGMVAESFISRLLGQQLSPVATVGYLIAAANENGGDDNVTVALVRA